MDRASAILFTNPHRVYRDRGHHALNIPGKNSAAANWGSCPGRAVAWRRFCRILVSRQFLGMVSSIFVRGKIETRHALRQGMPCLTRLENYQISPFFFVGLPILLCLPRVKRRRRVLQSLNFLSRSDVDVIFCTSSYFTRFCKCAPLLFSIVYFLFLLRTRPRHSRA